MIGWKACFRLCQSFQANQTRNHNQLSKFYFLIRLYSQNLASLKIQISPYHFYQSDTLRRILFKVFFFAPLSSCGLFPLLSDHSLGIFIPQGHSHILLWIDSGAQRQMHKLQNVIFTDMQKENPSRTLWCHLCDIEENNFSP